MSLYVNGCKYVSMHAFKQVGCYMISPGYVHVSAHVFVYGSRFQQKYGMCPGVCICISYMQMHVAVLAHVQRKTD